MTVSVLCSFASGLLSILIPIGLLAIVGLMIYAAMKFENARPFCVFFLMIAWFFGGVFSAFKCWNYYSTVSKVYGKLEEHDLYEDFNFFEYTLTDFALEKDDNDNFYYKKTYETSIEFDGTDKHYTLLLNNKPCDFTQSAYGKLNAHTTIHFDNTDGSYKCGIALDINFTFYNGSHIDLRIDTNATHDNAGLLNEYFKINGFNLRILNEVYSSFPLLTEKAV